MKVRVRQHHNKLWMVEVWKWYWPFWVMIELRNNFDDAMSCADRIKNPTIVEVQ